MQHLVMYGLLRETLLLPKDRIVNKETNFQVHDTQERSFIRVSNKASYLNCGPLRDFIENRLESGQVNFVVDFLACDSVDSTFLGILVKVAIRVRGRGSLSLINLRNRNLETVQHLGIHKIASICSKKIVGLNDLKSIESNSVSKNTIYQAHKSLVDLNDKNQKVFCDVLQFLQRKKDDVL